MIEQPDLFAYVTRPIFDEVVARRDRGMQQSAAHAERVTPEWQERAIGYIKAYAAEHREFLCEAVRSVAEIDGFTTPPDKRAWGAAMVAAMRRHRRELRLRASEVVEPEPEGAVEITGQG